MLSALFALGFASIFTGLSAGTSLAGALLLGALPVSGHDAKSAGKGRAKASILPIEGGV
jgi:hypothetical protein